MSKNIGLGNGGSGRNQKRQEQENVDGAYYNKVWIQIGVGGTRLIRGV